jgi:Holliday junction resolvasome RuvABC endonuclease subunit
VTILSLDPSSTLTGYALMSGDSIVSAGLLKPHKRSAPARERVRHMAADLRVLIGELKPDRIVIEVSSGHVSKRHRGSGAGLAVYGYAVGFLSSVAHEGGREVAEVEENEWTRGVPKPRRVQTIAALYPSYRMDRDKGGDMADAIGLGRWYGRTMRMKGCAA